MQALGNIPYAIFVFDVKRLDALPVLVPNPRTSKPIWREAVTAGMECDNFRDRQRPFHHRLQLVAHLHVLPETG